jgi:hypothetical protein
MEPTETIIELTDDDMMIGGPPPIPTESVKCPVCPRMNSEVLLCPVCGGYGKSPQSVVDSVRCSNIPPNPADPDLAKKHCLILLCTRQVIPSLKEKPGLVKLPSHHKMGAIFREFPLAITGTIPFGTDPNRARVVSTNKEAGAFPWSEIDIHRIQGEGQALGQNTTIFAYTTQSPLGNTINLIRQEYRAGTVIPLPSIVCVSKERFPDREKVYCSKVLIGTVHGNKAYILQSHPQANLWWLDVNILRTCGITEVYKPFYLGLRADGQGKDMFGQKYHRGTQSFLRRKQKVSPSRNSRTRRNERRSTRTLLIML